MKKIYREDMLALLNVMQSFAQPDSEGGRRLTVSIQQLMDAMKQQYPDITLQQVHVLCRKLIKEEKIWCLDRGDQSMDKSQKMVTFGIIEPTEEPEVPNLSTVERAAILVGKLSERIEARAGLKNIGKEMAIEIRQTINDLMSEIQK